MSSLLNAEDVATMLGVSRDWIYSETRAGRIPHVKLGRHCRYRPESIHAWLAELEAGGSVSGTNRGGTARTARPTAPRSEPHEHPAR